MENTRKRQDVLPRQANGAGDSFAHEAASELPSLNGAATFPTLALQHVVSFLTVVGVSNFIPASRTCRFGITPRMASHALLREFGQELGTWLSKMPLPKRLAVVRCLSAPLQAPQLHVCEMLASSDNDDGRADNADTVLQTNREGHSIVALPRSVWPARMDGDKDALGALIVFGGSEAQSPEPLASSFVVTLSGSLNGASLKAECQPLVVDSPPPPRLGHGALWLGDLCAMVVFGGRRGLGPDQGQEQTTLGDLWLLEHLNPLSHMSEWRWTKAKPVSETVPQARCHFASCEISGRSFFLHGGHAGSVGGPSELFGDCWVCWIDDGFDELDEFDVSFGDPWDAPQPQRQSTAGMCNVAGVSGHLSREVSEHLTKQVSDSYKRIAPQVSLSSASETADVADELFEAHDMITATWSLVVADGPSPPRCCGHAAVCCRDAVILCCGWSGCGTAHQLSPIFVLQGLANPHKTAGVPPRRPMFSEVMLPGNAVCRPFGTLHSIGGHAVPVGGWSNSTDPKQAPGGVQRSWHAACRLPMSEACGPLVAAHGGRDHSGCTKGDLLLLHWVV
mmetsp:Transcript_87905/g.246919  ORF Transcript_87905/g.246919 Transcript_87905/m.246919 type:complete len:564 (-) Transcript_87905:140-1831(-)